VRGAGNPASDLCILRLPIPALRRAAVGAEWQDSLYEGPRARRVPNSSSVRAAKARLSTVPKETWRHSLL
jgi:hypothetical protein